MSSDWGSRPSKKKNSTVSAVSDGSALDAFVQSGKGATKRLNLNIPSELHRRVKMACARDGSDMTAVIIALLEQRFPRE